MAVATANTMLMPNADTNGSVSVLEYVNSPSLIQTDIKRELYTELLFFEIFDSAQMARC